MPITAARRTYSAIAVRPIPTDREITRSLTPQAYFRRRTSRIFRIGNLSAGIGPPIASTAKGGTLPRSDCRQRPPSHPINRVAAFVRIGWPLSIGIGGRLPSESVAALPRIPQVAKMPSSAPRIDIGLLAAAAGEAQRRQHFRACDLGVTEAIPAFAKS